MSGKAPGYIWQKRVTSEWMRKHAQTLEQQTGGAHAVIERAGRARIEVEFFSPNLRAVSALRETFGGSVRRLAKDWEARLFESHRTRPLRIGRRLIIKDEPDPVSAIAVLSIPAGAAFGTGEHATTAMSLRRLEEISRRLSPGWRMLDAGTGSGILALAGRLFGAGEVIAIDNDPAAIRTARENARRNRVRGMKFVVADIADQTSGRFDIITANLYSELLEKTLPRFRRSLQPDGHLILSGVLRLQEPQLKRALGRNGFRLLEARRRGKWIAMLCSQR